jgi:hypothetical protein
MGAVMRKIREFTLIFGWLFLCSVCFGYSGGSGTASDPCQISSSNDLLELAADTGNYDKFFILTANIDMQGQVFTTAIIAPDNDGVIPGFQGTAFAGLFDGRGHKIMNFTIDGQSNDFLGLFGQVGSGAVNNLGLENCTVLYTYDSEFIGGLAGYNYEASISHCSMSGDVIGESESANIGGLIGFNFKGVIDRCYSEGNVGGMIDGAACGGLIGLNSLDGVITHCYATGDVAGDFGVGGLCGDNGGTIIDCYAEGNVTGSDMSWFLGGLCGTNFGSVQSSSASGSVTSGYYSSAIGGLCGLVSAFDGIMNSYATGPVTVGAGSEKIGGFCGENDFGVIANSYSTGVVSGGDFSDLVGGFCGFQSDSEIHNSFWDVESSTMGVGYNLDPDYPGIIINVFGLSTGQMQMQSTFTDYGWDFAYETANGMDDTWRMCEDGIGYSKLTWQSATGDLDCPEGVGSEDLDIMAYCWLSVVRTTADINDDNAVNLADFFLLARYWQAVGCGLCGGADVTGDGNVDDADLIKIAEQWLALENAECGIADLNADDKIDLKDVAIFAQHWLEGDPGSGVE